MNRAENVTVHHECSRHRGCEDDTVGLAHHYCHAAREICGNRETVRLRRVLVADEDANHIALVDSNHGPWVCGGSVSYTIVES
jgi:hypothetical protein